MEDCVLYRLKVWSNLSILILIMCTWWGGYVHLIVIAIGEKRDYWIMELE